MSEPKPKHPASVEKYPGTLEDLAKAIGSMRYDKVADFLGYLAQYAEFEAKKDLADGKVKLPAELFLASKLFFQAQKTYESAWEICKPYMKNE
ncbi:hypothetical protein HY494_00165 [Candidatus Woesearchaeota archaeon]|nr:hypothetical protein [Candidatus Woesearchaeota archaeon]